VPGSHSSYSMEAARAKGLPVIYTTGERRPDNWDALVHTEAQQIRRGRNNQPAYR
jgi:hypothetical protein